MNAAKQISSRVRSRPWCGLLLCLSALLLLASTGCDTGKADQATPTGSPVNPGSRGAINVAPCGAELGFAGYSVTLTTDPDAPQKMAASLDLGADDYAPEFLRLTSTGPQLSADAQAQALALDRMQAINIGAFARLDQAAILAKLGQATDVTAAEPIWVQSTEKRYLSCDGKLRDNATDQALAALAREALIVRGISTSTLDDPGTEELVSLRHFNGKQMLQVAFVRRPVGEPSAAYVAVLDPGTNVVRTVVRANWYLWG